MPLKDLPPQISEALQTFVQRVDTQAVANFVVVLLKAAAAGIPEGKAPVPKAEVTPLLAQLHLGHFEQSNLLFCFETYLRLRALQQWLPHSDCKPCSASAQ